MITSAARTGDERGRLLVTGGQGPRQRVVVIGGGIAGLSAAHSLLSGSAPDGSGGLDVTVVEADDRVGGKLAVSAVADVPLDEGAEAMQATRPEAVGLARAVGLDTDIVYPAATGAGIWTRGKIRPMPPSVMGVPTDLRKLAASGVLPMRTLLCMPWEPIRQETLFEDDVSVGAFVGERLGRDLVDTLVEPLLGGVYAGRADALSLRATVPTLYREVRRERSLLKAAERTVRSGDRAAGARRGPVFAGLRGGVGRLPAAVADDIVSLGGQVLLGRRVRSLHRTDDRWRVVVGDPAGQQVITADAVILAVPAAQAAALLGHLAPGAAAEFGLVPYASMATVALAYRRSDVPGGLAGTGLAGTGLVGTGFLVPPREERSIKAATFSSNKWAWVATMARSGRSDGMVIVRTSLGRWGEEQILERDDADLVGLSHADLAGAIGIGAPPVASRVTRWWDALPQYGVGHVSRIERIRARISDMPGLQVCGAAYEGVGVAAVIGSARSAAAGVRQHLQQRAQLSHG